MTTAIINHINGDKAPLSFEKQGRARYRKSLPMESAIKMIDRAHPGSDNDGKQQKQQ